MEVSRQIHHSVITHETGRWQTAPGATRLRCRGPVRQRCFTAGEWHHSELLGVLRRLCETRGLIRMPSTLHRRHAWPMLYVEIAIASVVCASVLTALGLCKAA